MRIKLIPLFLMFLAALLAACSGDQWGKRETGGVLGGVGGGVLGSQFGGGSGKTAATIAGVILGAGLGGYIGNQMDENDKVKVSRALEYNETGQSLPWRNQSTGRSYEVTPTRTYEQSSGRYCREFNQKIWVDGREETAYGTACRQEDGTWKITQMQ